MNYLFLVGYMGCGKSSLGRKIARQLDYVFADTDSMVEEQEGASVTDIFQYEGEERFREMERAALERALSLGERVVVSTGGGLPVWRDNMERMNGVGLTVYLRRSAEQIARRLSPYGRQKRPKLRGLSDTELIDYMMRNMAEREPFYARAQMIVECEDRSDAELIEEILLKINQEK